MRNVYSSIATLLAMLLVGTPVWCQGEAKLPGVDSPQAGIEALLSVEDGATHNPVDTGVLRDIGGLRTLYANRDYQPLWHANGHLTPPAVEFLDVVGEVEREGLRRNNYHYLLLERLISATAAGETTDHDWLDVVLTDAFASLVKDYARGRLDPNAIDPEWGDAHRDIDWQATLRAVLASGQTKSIIRGLLPDHPSYVRLRATLDHYRALQRSGGWETIPSGRSLRLGDQGERATALRRRLSITDAAPLDASGNDHFDETLDTAVRAFQKRHGLLVDGIVGRRTLEALNVPITERIAQMEVNLERWRWLPHRLGTRYVMINIASFELQVIENDWPRMSMRVVVGTPFQRTPVFSDNIRYLVFNPSWGVPTKIATEELLPLIQRDVSYLARNDFTVLDVNHNPPQPIDPSQVNWQKLSVDYFPYRLRQEAGAKNPLGRIKFMFPNQYQVYLHDSPARALFLREQRGFSHGCIRVERAVPLASYLLGDDKEWGQAAIEKAIASGEERTVLLQRPLPVHIVYFTAWTDESGKAQFRPDIYERDKALLTAMKKGRAEGD